MSNIDFDTVAVKMEGITKRFGSFVANDNINLTVHKGEIHALLGENGAGKSTLMNILYGLLQPNEGSIYINGEEVHITEPNVAIKHGIGMVHQHFMLIPPFTVTENIILGMEPVKGAGVIDKKKARKEVMELSERYGLNVDPDARIKDLSVGMQQRVEIIKALYRGAEIFILDEPTAVLTPQEIGELINIMNSLTEQGKTIIIITHKLAEIKQSSDFCTIIRRGKYIDTVDVSKTNESELASKMVGREVLFTVDRGEFNPGDVALSVEGLWAKGKQGLDALRDINLQVRRGEILGIVGIDGNGQTELVEALTGLMKTDKGSIKVNGKDIANHTPRQIIEHRVGSIPEDRQRRGLVLEYTTAENMILSKYMDKPFSKRGILNEKEIKANADRLIDRFDVRPPDPQHKAGELSGGNQQKVIIAREVSNEPDVLIAAQPTRGLDVGAIEFVHKSLVEQRDNGKAILLVSLELDEVLNLSDRIAVIYAGKIVGELDPTQTDENEIGLLMAGGKANAGQSE